MYEGPLESVYTRPPTYKSIQSHPSPKESKREKVWLTQFETVGIDEVVGMDEGNGVGSRVGADGTGVGDGVGPADAVGTGDGALHQPFTLNSGIYIYYHVNE